MNILKSAALAAFLLASLAPSAFAQDTGSGEQGGADSDSSASSGSSGGGEATGSDADTGNSTESDTTNPAQDCPEGQTAAADGTCVAAAQ